MTTERRCLYCNTGLPPRSRSDRRYCSTVHRVRAWDLRNPPPVADPSPDVLYAKTNPKHYHRRSGYLKLLVGHRDNVPWFGKACPPQCPGLGPDETFEPMELIYARSPVELRAARLKGVGGEGA